jgi:hypothetical protein
LTPAEQLNPAYWDAERIERVRKTSPRTYLMHIMNLFGAVRNGAFDMDQLRAAEQERECSFHAGPSLGLMDASGGGKDQWTWGFVHWRFPIAQPEDRFLHEERTVYTSARLRDGLGTPSFPTVTTDEQVVARVERRIVRDANGQPLPDPAYRPPKPWLCIEAVDGQVGGDWNALGIDSEDIVRRIGKEAKRRGVRRFVADQYSADTLKVLFRQDAIRLEKIPFTNESKSVAVDLFRKMLRDRAVQLPPDPRLRSELLSFEEKLSAGGLLKYEGRRGGHDDFAVLPLLAVLADLEGFIPGSPSVRRSAAQHNNAV